MTTKSDERRYYDSPLPIWWPKAPKYLLEWELGYPVFSALIMESVDARQQIRRRCQDAGEEL